MKLIEVNKIWDQGAHNAFTDLICFNGQWYCSFREAEHHMSYDGKIRILRSQDGNSWESIALLDYEKGDLRDPKFSKTSTNELMLNCGIRFENPVDGNKTASVTYFSKEGVTWNGPFLCESGLNTWRWSTTWHKEKAYSFAYTGKDSGGTLYRSSDGKNWSEVVKKAYFEDEAYGNESSLLFLDNDEAYCLLRRDNGSFSALFGTAQPPYDQWNWQDLKQYVGGPKMIQVNNRFLVAGRFVKNKELYTGVCWLEPNGAILSEVMRVPSSGDSSYPGLVWDGETVWMSYYSSHEEKSAIYLAKIALDS